MLPDNFKVKTTWRYIKERGIIVPCILESFSSCLLVAAAFSVGCTIKNYRKITTLKALDMKYFPYVGAGTFFGTWVLCRNLRSEDSVSRDDAEKDAIVYSVKEMTLEEEVQKITAKTLQSMPEDKENTES